MLEKAIHRKSSHPSYCMKAHKQSRSWGELLAARSCWSLTQQEPGAGEVILRSYVMLSHFSLIWLCDPIDGSPPGSPVPGILQARTLEWVAISFSSALKWKVKVKSLSRVVLLATPWTTAYQAPLSMGFSRQEYWSGVPLPSPPQKLSRDQLHILQEPGEWAHQNQKGKPFLLQYLSRVFIDNA